MGKKRQSDNQRVISFGLAASEGELALAIEALQTISASRFPKAPKAAPKKVRSDKGTTRKATTPPTQPNGGDNDGSTITG